MALIDDIKAAVRIADSATQTAAEAAREGDIQGYIDACKDDLRRAGIRENLIRDDDPRIVNACKLFVMASIDYQGKGTEYWERYQKFAALASLDADYREAADV